MNWRRGMFRIWAAFSVIWVIYITFAVWGDYPYLDTTRVHSVGSDGRLISRYQSDDVLKEALERGLAKIIRFDDDLKVLVNTKLPGADMRERSLEIRKVLEADINKRKSEYIRRNRFNYFVYALSVPLSLLFLGSLIAWALAGFRR